MKRPLVLSLAFAAAALLLGWFLLPQAPLR